MHESDVGLVSSDSLNERLSENQVIRRSVVDGERRERGGEPRLVGDGGVEDAVGVGEVGHVVCVEQIVRSNRKHFDGNVKIKERRRTVEKFRRGGDTDSSEVLWDLSIEPLLRLKG